ncbi:MAG: hypothetical protein IPP37_19755 [Saprospiraceae bacterium]|nr:hypothetical protein [Saprospiraceae bacterium]
MPDEFKSMKNFVIIMILFASCHSQNNLIENQFNVAITKLNPIFMEILAKYNTELFESQGNGAAILLKSKIDTLDSNNDYSNWEIDEFEKSGQDVWIAAGELKESKLLISVGQIFGNQFIQYIVEEDEISTIFSEYYKSDNLLKQKKSDEPTNKLIIPLEISEIELSKTKNFAIGEVIYGKSKIITEPYYLKPMGFDFEYIKREYELYFKFKVR